MRAVLLAALAVFVAACSPQAWTCVADDGVDPGERAKIEEVALGFVRNLNTGDTVKARQYISAEVRPNADGVLGELSKRLKPAGAMPWKIDGVYYLDDVVGSQAMCVDRTTTNVFNTVSVKPAARQAHVFVVDGAPLEAMFSLWLVEESGAWKVHGLSVNMSRIAGRDTARLFKSAEEQLGSGDKMLAALLFETARGLTDRGSYFSLGLRERMEARAAEFSPPSELVNFSKPWRLGGADYPVKGFKVGAVGDLGFSLQFSLAWPEWKGEADADRRAHAFVDAFVAAHPGWDREFDAILVRTEKPGGYRGTVYEKGTGYLAAPPPRS